MLSNMYQNKHLTHQFPQPTRPLCFSHLPHLVNSDGIQFPQPSSSVMFPNEERVTASTAATTSAVSADGGEAVADELVMILLECFERVDTNFKELLLRKVFSELEKEAELESFIIERLEHSKVKAISELLERHHQSGGNLHNTFMRELVVDPTARKDLDGPVEDLTPKLERFKVRPIKLTGIVKKEGE